MDYFFGGVVKSLAALFILVFISMAFLIFIKAWPAFYEFGFSFFANPTWNNWTQEFGTLSLIYGTLVSSLLALLIAVPVSVALALFLNELAPKWLALSLSFVVEMLAAIPSIVYGLWGVFVFAPFLRSEVQPFLSKHLGFFAFFFRALLWRWNALCRLDPGNYDHPNNILSLQRGFSRYTPFKQRGCLESGNNPMGNV